MSFFIAVVIAACAVGSTTAISTTQQGTHDGFYFYFWTDGGSNPMNYQNLAGGEYSVQWGSGGNWFGGKGWKPGIPNRVVNFSGSFNPNGNSYLGFYGWNRNPFIEYYVVENFGIYNPTLGATSNIKGTVTTDGGTYDIFTIIRNSLPSINGQERIQQFWAVRREKRSSGTITFSNIVNAWKSFDMNLGSDYEFQIMATEGYFSNGSAQIKVSEGSISTPPPTTTYGGLRCNYNGEIFPICRKVNDWSTENGATCVGIKLCVAQSPPFGVIVNK